jgi:hypothetical protein
MMDRLVNSPPRHCCSHSLCLLLVACAPDSSGATTCHRRLCCSDPSRNNSGSHACSVQDSSGCSQRCSHQHPHHLHCVANDESRAGSGYTHCRARPSEHDDRSRVIAVTQRCFAAAVHLAIHCSCQTDLAAATEVVSRQSLIYCMLLLAC